MHARIEQLRGSGTPFQALILTKQTRSPRRELNRRFIESRTHAKTAPSLLGLAATKRLQCKKDPAGLAPKGCLVAAKAIKREVRQIGQAQKATGELDSRIIGRNPILGNCNYLDLCSYLQVRVV